jgi:hypothetical protein
MALFDEGPREAAASMLQCFGGLPEGALRTPTRGRDQGTWKHSSTMVNQFVSGTRRFRSLPLATNTLPAAQKETLVLVRNGVLTAGKAVRKTLLRTCIYALKKRPVLCGVAAVFSFQKIGLPCPDLGDRASARMLGTKMAHVFSDLRPRPTPIHLGSSACSPSNRG